MRSEKCMTTRSPKTPSKKPGEGQTDFQLHKSQLPVDTSKRNVFDYTVHRLRLYIQQVKDENQKITLAQVLEDYKKGKVAVAWKAGKPVWLSVTKS